MGTLFSGIQKEKQSDNLSKGIQLIMQKLFPLWILKEKQLNTIQTWMTEKIIETYISVNQDSRECNFANKWLKK